MSRTGEIVSESAPARRQPGVLRASGEFGEVGRVCRRLLESEGVMVVVGAGREPSADAVSRLAGALAADPGAAFAIGLAGGVTGESRAGVGPCGAVGAEHLIVCPTDPGPVAIRCEEAARLGWPDFGPPDFVLDDAIQWVLAAALAVRGGRGLWVAGVEFGRAAGLETAMGRLRPEGRAWLASSALGWGESGRPGELLAERCWVRWTAWGAALGFDGLTAPDRGGR